MKIRVFDPPMCCSIGVCGITVGPQRVRFSADLDWLKAQGITVERFNLLQHPFAFAGDADVTWDLQVRGEGALPIVKDRGDSQEPLDLSHPGAACCLGRRGDS